MVDLGISTIGNRCKSKHNIQEVLMKPSTSLSASASSSLSELSGQQQQKDQNDQRQSKGCHHQQQNQQKQQQEKAVQMILKRLEHDSRFFESNQPYTLPNFSHSEMELSPNPIGKGEFGVVYAVSAIHVADECPCPKCQANRYMDTDNYISTTTKTMMVQANDDQKQLRNTNQNSTDKTQPQEQPPPKTSSFYADTKQDSEKAAAETKQQTVADGTNNTSASLTNNTTNQPTQQAALLKGIVEEKYAPGLQQQAATTITTTTTPSNNADTTVTLTPLPSPTKESAPSSSSTAAQTAAASAVLQRLPSNLERRRHGRVTSHITFAEDVKTPDDDSTLSTESDPEDYLMPLLNDNGDDNDNDTDGEAAFLRGYMSTHVLRERRPRYAVKRLHLRKREESEGTKDTTQSKKNQTPKRNDNDNDDPFYYDYNEEDEQHLFEAAVDLATEAKFLASIRHPNIVKMRGTVGTPGCFDFMIIMDCLVMTLRDKLKLWQDEQKQQNSKRFFWNAAGGQLLRRWLLSKKSILGGNSNTNHHDGSGGGGSSTISNCFGRDDPLLMDQHCDKLLAVYDIARAMRYLHNQFIIFRDLKPENVAFDVRGDMRLFDFGLAKELKQKDLRQPPDGFNATGLTGSRRYMAPEVVQCKNYGLSADVYSYSIVFWEVFSGKMAFPKMNLNKHFEHVVLKHKRPNKKKISKLVSKQLETMMMEMWAPNPLDRPSFKSICEQLGAECVIMNANSNRSGQSQLSDRTSYLMNRSLKSQQCKYNNATTTTSSSNNNHSPINGGSDSGGSAILKHE